MMSSIARSIALSLLVCLISVPVLAGPLGQGPINDPTLPIERPDKPALPGMPGDTLPMIESRLGFMITSPLLFFNNTGELSYSAATDAMTIAADPLAIRLNAIDPPISIFPSGGNRYLTINAIIDNAGNLVSGVPGNDLEIFGEVTIDGMLYSGLLLSGEVTEYMGEDGVGSTDFHSFRFNMAGGLLVNAGIYGMDVGIEITSEMSDYTGDYTVDFSGEAKGNVGDVECTGTIGDFVWLDLNGNGIQDDGEPGIEGVGLTLSDGSGNVLAMTATDSNGFYQFTGLCGGDYLITVDMPPPGLDVTLIGAPGSNDDNDSNDPGGTPVTLPNNDTNDQTIDFGYVEVIELGSLGDYVWNDLNMDGVQDGNEPPIEGVMVNLYDCDNNFLGSTTTDEFGFYQFTELAEGCYVVEFILPPGFVFSPMDQTGDAFDSDPDTTTGLTDQINLGQGENNPDIDAGMFVPPSAELGDRFWEDLNGNGIQDPGEPGIPGVTVNLLDCEGNLLDSTTTGANGDYLFPDLPAGCYVIEFVPPQDCVLTLQDVEPDDAADSDADPLSGQTTQISLADMQSDLTWDAGCYYPAGLGDFIWNDLDQDGIQDDGEPGIEGLTVVLLDADMMPTGLSTVTGPNGEYEFTGLAPGSYFVQFTAPAGFVFTLQDVGDDATDSDANGTGKSDKIILESGEFDPTIDAGVFVPNAPQISIEKSTNGDDADNPTGPFIPDGEPVLWEYVVTNTGNVTLTDIFVVDDQGVAVDCPTDTLAPTETMTCTGTGPATVDQYQNLGTTCGIDFNGIEVCDDDPSHYFGADPSIDIEKATNGEDADTPTGPYITPGASVTWSYVVENTGNVTLSDVTVTDDQGVTVTCPLDTLSPGQIMICTADGTAAAGQYANVGSVIGTPPDGAGDPVDDEDPSHYFGALPGIDIEKATNGEDADIPTGPFINIGGDVNWTYLVTNTGNVTLTDVTVTDDQGVAVSCPASELAPGDSFTCTASGSAIAGQYANLGSVTGEPPQGPPVDDEDPSHYFGADPAIDIEKATNGDDADTPTGPFINIGGDVNWTYLVTNTGNVTLTDVTVTDDQGVAVSCPASELAPGDSFTCTASGSAIAGQYANIGSVSGNPPAGDPVTDMDPSHYFGADPAIDIEKATNGDDADTPHGPVIPIGSTVSWTYVVTNTGNVTLTDIVVTDDQGVSVSCPLSELAPTESMICTGSGLATAGLYANIGQVCGIDPTGAERCDDDPSHYYGSDPSIDIEKATNGDDADSPTGPFVAIGSTVNWTYVVTNTGNVVLTGIVVTDDQGVTVTCPVTELVPTESMTCTASGTATAGQYANIGDVFGTPPIGLPVTDRDPSHYFGVTPGIDIEKSTNGVDADDPNAGDAPQLAPGDTVTWTYLVTNLSNVPLDNVVVSDDQGVAVVCPATSLAAFASFTCTANGIAEDLLDTTVTTVPGLCGDRPDTPLYQNTGTVSANSAVGVVSDSDLSHYCNQKPFCVVAAVSDPMWASFGGDHAFWLPGIDTDNEFLPEAGSFNENADGTAVLSGRIANRSDPSKGFDVVVNLTGATDIPPPGSPKLDLLDSAYIENGGPVDPSTWRYYADYTGTLVGFGNYAGSVIEIVPVVAAFQIGVGANQKNINFGASSWFDWWVTSQPNSGSFPSDGRGDINVDLRDECIPSECTPGDFADHFGADRFDNNDGSLDWSTPWIEDDVAGTGPTAGNVKVWGGILTLEDYPDTGTHPSAAREADLSQFTSAILSFDFDTTDGVDSDDTVILEVSNDGGASYEVLEVFMGQLSGSRSYDISGFISSETRIRFRVSKFYGGDWEVFEVDNLRIEGFCDTPPPPDCEPGFVKDRFSSDSFDNNDGSVDWSTSWIEEDVAGAGPTAGTVQVWDGRLRLDDRPDTGTEPSIAREVDLSPYASATLSFDFWTTEEVDESDAVTLEISTDGGATYQTLEVFTDIDGASDGWRSYDISGYISSETRIRFRVSNLYGGDKEHFKVDDVRIDFECD